jgi:hypothetical protein
MPPSSAASIHGLILVATLPFLAAMAPASPAADSPWAKVPWRGEAAWTATRGPVRAVVTEARCRLIYLGSLDGATNLLNAPYPREPASAGDPSPNQGGHRFWLGPQTRWKWPPPGEWEYSPAAAAAAAGPVLTMVQQHFDPGYPALAREYAWEGARLRCTVRWRYEGRPYFGIHVIPVDVPVSVQARLVKSDGVPAGAVAAEMAVPEPTLAFPHPSVAVNGDLATVSSGIKTLKIGFAPQALTVARRGGWTLSVLPGPSEGVVLGAPDHGYLSQVWVGAAQVPLAELEQLSPCLTGDAQGRCASTIYLEATAPSP